MNRREAREAALHALYALTYHHGCAKDDIDAFVSAETLAGWRGEADIYKNPPDDVEAAYIKAVVAGVWEKSAEYDAVIAARSVGWSVGRITRLSLILMKMAMFEPVGIEGVTTAIAINEAVELCKRYDCEEAAAFINGILGVIARETLA